MAAIAAQAEVEADADSCLDVHGLRRHAHVNIPHPGGVVNHLRG